MSDKKAGTGADVGVVKRDGSGDVEETGGDFIPGSAKPAKLVYYIIYAGLVLAVVGAFRIAELLLQILL